MTMACQCHMAAWVEHRVYAGVGQVTGRGRPSRKSCVLRIELSK
jgi:hypothetical protein